MKSPLLNIFLLALIFLLYGCKSVRENLDNQYDRVEKIYSETYNRSQNKEGKELAWGEALKMMMVNNLELQRAIDSLERAKESRAQIYWDLVPTLRFSKKSLKAFFYIYYLLII